MKLLLYCTKGKPYLYKNPNVLPNEFDRYLLSKYNTFYSAFGDNLNYINDKIVGECDFEVETIHCETHYEPEVNIGVGILPEFTCNQYSTETLGHFKLLEKSCLKDLTLPYEEHRNELDEYLKHNNGYAIHIKNLHIFNKPKKLDKYFKCYKRIYENIEKAPQNICYIYENPFLDKKDVLISIHPQWLAKILNGECTIIIRKKILKGMIKDETTTKL